MMKKTIAIALAALMSFAALTASGCKRASIQTFGNVNMGILLYQDLAVEDVMIDSFDTSLLDLTEYRSLLDGEVKEYNDAHEFRPGSADLRSESEPAYSTPVTVTKCEVTDKTIYQQLLYANTGDFLAYNEDLLSDRGGSKLSAGTLASVDTTILTADIISPGKGEKVNVNQLCLGQNAAQYRYLICDLKAVLYGEGTLIGYSSNAAYDAASNRVTSKGGEPVIVIYK